MTKALAKRGQVCSWLFMTLGIDLVGWSIRSMMLIRLTPHAPIGSVAPMPRPDFPRALRDFQRRFADEKACRGYLAASRWPDGYQCPRCGGGEALELPTPREGEEAHGHVRDLRVEIITGLRLHRIGHLAQEPEDHRDVVRREGPEDVFFSPDLAEVEAIGIDVPDTA